MIDNSQLQKILPQAYPFLLLDRVEDVRPGHSLLAVKNITANEWPFSQERRYNAHYPETLLIEAAAQAALVLYHISKNFNNTKNLKYSLGKIRIKFESLVVPPDQLKILSKANKLLDYGGYSEIKIFTDIKLVGNLELIYAVKQIN